MPDRNWLTTRPVVRKIGYSALASSTGIAVVGDVETGAAVGEIERSRALRDRVVAARFEQPWRAFVIRRRRAGLRIVAVAGPEHAHLALDLFVGHARVVGDAALAGDAQLLEDLARAREREAVRTAQRGGDVLNDPPVLARLARTIHRLVDLDDASFDLRDRALVFLVQAARQHDVGMAGGVVQEEVDRDVELELVEAAGDERVVGQRDLRIEADRRAGP